ncbi:hypothetical protein CONCODRAFT_12636 [Conidiobolus coronatus NRRL 28638]|uniref:Uncharacterized protein n=1 Tax=Conidiobolus coronatus (strain ATCC 28846 / CBS 209.66 / NRRL 28638) TaxID=796925 RepID=A0A137NSH4_CONC2|nr:hypothetical protein CONCODRAFT_12636 [Conidiobolus coronatus NRRL 28638]|eukprot:KXN65707.1 hypothetical protein CONCODRAFT_12636 [Conidiobolus coronatus NRRL 28638]
MYLIRGFNDYSISSPQETLSWGCSSVGCTLYLHSMHRNSPILKDLQNLYYKPKLPPQNYLLHSIEPRLTVIIHFL